MIKQNTSLKLKQTQKLITKIKIANIMSLSEEKYNILIKEIEGNHLFKKLMYSENNEERILSYRRFPLTYASNSFYGLKEEVIVAKRMAGTNFMDIDSMLKEKEKIVQLIKNVGEKNFKKYFLYNEGNLSLQEIAGKCNVEKEEAGKIIDLLNTIDIHNAFYDISTISTDYKKKYVKIASIKRTSSKDEQLQSDFVIEFFYINSARGKYKIDYDKVEALKSRRFFSKEEFKELNKLIKSIELINAKKTTIYRIIEKIIEKQNKYLKSDDLKDLVPFNEKQLAMEMDVDCSVISRAISNRSIETPWGIEKPLKDFLPNRKDVSKKLVYGIISREGIPYTDDVIRDRLRKDFGINVSRRSVASYRLEMNLPSNFKRKKQEDK